VVRQTIQIEGVPLHVVDTAGLREGADQVEQIGIERAWGQIERADAVVFLHDLTRADAVDYREADEAIRAKLPQEVPVVDVWNKVDAAGSAPTPALPRRGREEAGGIPGPFPFNPAPFPVIPAEAGIQGVEDPGREPWIPASAGMTNSVLCLSAKTGAGLDLLRQRLLEIAGWQAAPEGVFIARERHLHALRRVDAHLMEAAAHLAQQAQSLDLLAEELRLAQNALAEITGEFTADDLLGVIFSRFCIGK
jgi:tRNA modification GTPase